MKLLSLLTSALAGLAMGLASPAALAQSPYPSRPVRLILPTPAGGPSDTAARALAQALTGSLGQPVVIENKPGAGGSLAAQALLAAPPDGYTLLWGLASMAGIPLLQKSPPFKSLSEFAPVSLVGHFGFTLFTHPDVPAANVAELVAYAKAHPDKLSYATGTLGEYMAAAQFIKATGVRMLRVPYKGGAQLMPDLLSGRVQVNFGPTSSGLQHARAGKLRMLATMLPEPSAVAPEVPTLAAAGVSTGTLPTWQAVFAPAGTPREITQRLSAAIAQAVKTPALRTQFDQQSLQPVGSTPQALAEVVVADTQAWQTFVRDYEIPQE